MRTLFWNITNRCNLNCRYCYYNTGIEKRVLQEANYYKSLLIINDISKNFDKIIFTGGEPLLYPNLFNLIKKVKEMKLFVQLLTNGVLLEKFSNQILNSGIDKLSISLDSPITKTNDYLRGSTRVVQKGILKLISNKKQETIIEIQQTLTRKNIDSLEPMLDFCKGHDLSLWINPVDIKPCSSTEELSLLNLSENTARKLKENIKKWLKLNQNEKNKIYADSIMALIKMRKPQQKTCNMGINNFVLDPEGNVYPCFLRKDIFLGNIYKNKLKDIIHNPLLNRHKIELSSASCLQLGCLCLTLL
ncbi:radical SAM protein [Candidatus Dojkabacteria bacterium]|nr:radical SAM protein [Candidatus Dojkabacteria bacterium]